MLHLCPGSSKGAALCQVLGVREELPVVGALQVTFLSLSHLMAGGQKGG